MLILLIFILTFMLILLKVNGYLTWEWWLIFAPLWGAIALPIVVLVLLCGLILLIDKVEK